MEAWPLRDVQSGVVYIPPMARTGVPFKNSITRQPSGGDRFIPDRSSMDLDAAHYLLTQSRKESTSTLSPNKEAYRRMLDSALMPNKNRILAFRGKTHSATTGAGGVFTDNSSNHLPKRRYIPQFADRTLDAPDIVDNFCLNFLDWGSKNLVSIALGDIIYLWDASAGSVSELMTVDQEDGPITSVSWAHDGQHLAVGLHSSDVQLWDCGSNRLIRTLRGTHQSRVGSLSWNNSTLTTGGSDGLIVNTNVRSRTSIVNTYRGHNQEVCGLKWSGTGNQLASGGNDNLCTYGTWRWPPAAQILSSGSGSTGSGTTPLLSRPWHGALSTVSGLLWNKHERELLSSHGQIQNQLTLWKYPSMAKVAGLTSHTSGVLYMAQSLNGSTVATAAADETLRF